MSPSRRRFVGSAAALGLSSPLPGHAQAARTLTLQAAGLGDAEAIGYFVALEKGWFREEGLELKFLPGGPEAPPEAAVQSGRAEVGLATLEGVIRAITVQKAPLVIIGAQFQKNPIGIVSLANRPIRSPRDLVGKTLAVTVADRPAVDALFALNGVDPAKVRIVPYANDPRPLLKGEIDAALDVTTRAPFTVKTGGGQASSFLLADFRLPPFGDVLVVKRDTLAARRADLVGFLRAGRRGWDENFRDAAAYPPKYAETWFKGAGRSIDSEIYVNGAQKSLIQHPKGVFTMSEASIKACIDALRALDIKAERSHFDTTLLARV
jgi:ABC-type nitrate/sulfonate/bicarbonate transport system substrate-binding protein